jgi:hypothetical protein
VIVVVVVDVLMQRVGTVCHDAIKLVLGKATATRNYHALTPKATIRQERGSTGHVMCAKMIKSHGSRLRLNDRLIMLLSLWAVQFFLETSGQFAGLRSVPKPPTINWNTFITVRPTTEHSSIITNHRVSNSIFSLQYGASVILF